MPERDPIDLIREQLSEAEGLALLQANHDAFKKWHDETKMILEKAFSPKSIHCQSFLALRFREMGATPFASPEIDKINAARYKRDLEIAKGILQGAIKELTLDRTLFKKIQTTPKSVDVALKGEYYLSPGIDRPDLIQVIHMAFEGSGLTPVVEGEANQKEETLHDRIERIKRAQIGIYDVSEAGKTDVFLEIGAALTLGKKTLLLCKKDASPPGTIKSYGCITYEDVSSLTEKLKKAIKG